MGHSGDFEATTGISKIALELSKNKPSGSNKASSVRMDTRLTSAVLVVGVHGV